MSGWLQIPYQCLIKSPFNNVWILYKITGWKQATDRFTHADPPLNMHLHARRLAFWVRVCVKSHLRDVMSLCLQDRRAVTCLFTTCRRSSGTRSSCRCSCPSATSFLPKSSWIGPPIRASVSVSSHNALALGYSRSFIPGPDYSIEKLRWAGGFSLFIETWYVNYWNIVSIN